MNGCRKNAKVWWDRWCPGSWEGSVHAGDVMHLKGFRSHFVDKRLGMKDLKQGEKAQFASYYV